MLTKDVKYQLVKAMVLELAELPSLPKSLEPGFIEHVKKSRQGMSEWACASDKEMREALTEARKCFAEAEKKNGKEK